MKKPSFLSRLRSTMLLLAATMLTPQGVWATETVIVSRHEIYNVNDWNNFRTTFNSQSGAAVKFVHEVYIDADFTIPSGDYSPIGTTSYPFSGRVYGSNHTITFDSVTTSSDDFGLFGCLGDESSVEDLTIDGTIIVNGAHSHIGGIAGCMKDNSTISGCSFIGTLDAGSSHDCIGGIVGFAESSLAFQHGIYKCFCNGTLKTTSTHSDLYMGGILGYFNDEKLHYPDFEDNFSDVSFHDGNDAGISGTYINGIIGRIRASAGRVYYNSSVSPITPFQDGSTTEADINATNQCITISVTSDDVFAGKVNREYVRPLRQNDQSAARLKVTATPLSSCYQFSNWTFNNYTDSTSASNPLMVGLYNSIDLTAHFTANHNWDANGECTHCHVRQSVSYIDPQTGESVSQTNVQPVTSSQTPTTWIGGWYYVSGNVTLTEGAVCDGIVNIILCDGATLTVSNSNDEKAGIRVIGSNRLNVYAQSRGASAGSLIATGGRGAAGIGGDCYRAGSYIYIYGGKVRVNGGEGAAGIGGGYDASANEIHIHPALTILAGNEEHPSTMVAKNRHDYDDVSAVLNMYRYVSTHEHVWSKGNRGACTFEDCPYHKAVYRVPTYKKDADNQPQAALGIASWSMDSVVTDNIVTASATTVTWSADKGVLLACDTVNLSDGATCSGDVKLVLCDGAKLTTSGTRSSGMAGVLVNPGNSLTIYAESEGESMGKLIASAKYHAAGIGSNGINACQNITINGGNVTATGGEYGSGIGAAYWGDASYITINGGIVTATGGEDGAGIGGDNLYGGNNHTALHFVINGGTVMATGGSTAPGIGSHSSYAGFITINDGNVTATGGWRAAGIGTGESCSNCVSWAEDITIHGGKVTATGGEDAAGIGGGLYSGCKNIIIDGGIIIAYGNNTVAIGTGGGMTNNSSNITIDSSLRVFGRKIFHAFDEEITNNGSDLASTLNPDLSTFYPYVSVNWQRYYRSMNNEWGTLAVPFDIEYDADNDTCRLYYPTEVNIGTTEGSITLTPYDKDTVIAAGTPLFVRASRDVVLYPFGVAGKPKTISQGLTRAVGSNYNFTGVLKEQTNVSGIYYMAQNQLWYAEQPVTIPANRAIISPVGSGPAPTRMSLHVEGEAGAVTDLENLSDSRAEGEKITKMLIDGRIFILRGNTLYDMNGRIVK